MRTIHIDEREDRLVVTLNRPEFRNAINVAMIEELHEVCADLERRPKLLLLTGAGSAFAGGADIAELLERNSDQALQGINARLFERMARLPLPTLAAVNGVALGGGAELAYACDLRVATLEASFGSPEPGLGIIAAAGACWRLTELVGKSVAKQVLLGGRTLDAQEALQFGLLSEVVHAADLVERAHQMLDQIARSSSRALRLTKLVVDAPDAQPLVGDLAQAILFDSDDKRFRMERFLERSRR